MEENEIMVNDEELETVEDTVEEESNFDGAIVLTALVSAGVGFAAAKLAKPAGRFLKKHLPFKKNKKSKDDSTDNGNSEEPIPCEDYEVTDANEEETNNK